jgi:mono/diheme cytochrome c family protein
MRKLALLLLINIFLFTNCSNEGSTQEKITTETSETIDIVYQSGALTFKKFCASCHQSNGGGVPGMYPPIIETEMVNGDKQELIKIIIHGMSGEIEVKGEIYNDVMPSHSHLTDKQIADLLTYIRGNFGNSSGAITEEEVKKVRNLN